MKTIRFKSIPDMFRIEYLDLKNNTLRKFDEVNDIRKEILDDFMLGKVTVIRIEIINTQTGEMFTRMVRDVTVWNDFYIITWFEGGRD